MIKKYFTPQEANQRLPYIKKIVEDILQKAQNYRDAQSQPISNEDSSELLKLQKDIEALINELEGLGCFYKDWNFKIGLVDFPAIINEEDVLLCWRSDEPDVQWYHGLQDGYAGRKPIPVEMLKGSNK